MSSLSTDPGNISTITPVKTSEPVHGFLVTIVGATALALSALVVYAQEIVPGRAGMVAGIMFGTMFGVSGLAAAGLGGLADMYGIDWVYSLCAFLPLLGFATLFMPNTKQAG